MATAQDVGGGAEIKFSVLWLAETGVLRFRNEWWLKYACVHYLIHIITRVFWKCLWSFSLCSISFMHADVWLGGIKWKELVLCSFCVTNCLTLPPSVQQTVANAATLLSGSLLLLLWKLGSRYIIVRAEQNVSPMSYSPPNCSTGQHTQQNRQKEERMRKIYWLLLLERIDN